MRNLGDVDKQTAASFLDLFEASHLVYRLKPVGYGKEVLRGRDKIDLADAALPGAVLLLGRKLLEQPDRSRAAVETAFFEHLFTRYHKETPRFSYWRDSRNTEFEVDVVAELGDRLVPLEVEYRGGEIGPKLVRGMRLFLEARGLDQGYVITQRWDDLGRMPATSGRAGRESEPIAASILRIPAPLACFRLSE
ncbi:MAG: DUF4143 domain-containing protein [Isosphaeraceae bacterium]|nr:DUF4143 domain-containing protein [Isosphaeraceae bacterium]